MTKRFIYLLLIILFISGCSKSNNVQEIVGNEKPIIEIEYKDDREVLFLSKVKVSDFILNINGTIEDYEIDTTEIGEKIVKYVYTNNQGIKINQEFSINVVDKNPPIIWVSGSYSLVKGENINIAEKIMCADDYDDNPTCYVEGKYDSNIVGSYNLKYIARDSSGNESSKDFTLKVVNPSKGNSSSTTKTNFKDVIKSHKNNNTEIGIDVSKWQGSIDFEKLKNAGVEFVFIRVGYSTGQGKENVVDENFVKNIKEANRVGMPVGIYYYSFADSKERSIADAKWVINLIKDYKIDLPIAYDWERWGAYNDYHQSIYHLTENAKVFLDTIHDAGYEGLLYSSKVFLESIWYDTGYNVWLAHWLTNYTNKSSYKGEYEYWQMANNGRVDGISTDVDINIRYLNK